MTGRQFNPSDSGYVEVAERIVEFREKHPDGSLQSEVIGWPTEAASFVTVKAYAYRTPDDVRPGTGLAWEPFPGRTPYTKDSEIQNAETSAWGRAIVAALAADTKRGIASANEVRNRAATQPPSGGSADRSRDAGGPQSSPQAIISPGPVTTSTGGAEALGEGAEGSSGGHCPHGAKKRTDCVLCKKAVA